MSKGIVVQHRDSNVRYAVSEENHDKASEDFIRDLKPGETILGYTPKQAPKKGEADPELDEATEPDTALQAPTITTEPTGTEVTQTAPKATEPTEGSKATK